MNRPKRTIMCSRLLVLSGGLCAVLLGVWGTQLRTTTPLRKARAEPAIVALGPGPRVQFSHRSHVHPAWALENAREVPRDCRGCHADPATRQPPTVRNNCSSCHTQLFEVDGRANDLDERGRAFRHQDHGGRECQECHYVDDATGVVGADMPVPVGIATCIQCHSNKSPDPHPDAVRPEVMKGLLARLNHPEVVDLGPRTFAAAADDADWQSGFRHEDHVPLWPDVDPEQWAKECTVCHRGVLSSVGLTAGPAGVDSDLGRKFLDLTDTACGNCHITRLDPSSRAPGPQPRAAPSGGSLVFELGTRSRESRSDGTFSHEDHLRFIDGSRPGADPAVPGNSELDDSRSRIRERGCLVCHQAKPGSAHAMVLHPAVFPAGESIYSGCVGCHQGWRVEQHRGAQPGLDEPSHDRIKEEEDRFGALTAVGDGRGACSKCHDLGYIADMMTLRQTRVARDYPAAFTTTSQAHPVIHRKRLDTASPIDATCSSCHKATPNERKSRVDGKAFRHSTHLPKLPDEPTASDLAKASQRCAQCHQGVAETRGPEELTRADAFKTSLEQCVSCHRGADLRAVPPESPDAVDSARTITLTVFAHRDHVGKSLDGQALSCATCHEAGVDSNEKIGVREEAKSCSPCHGHERRPDLTGKVSSGYVKNCMNCHDQGVPPSGAKPVVESGWSFIAGMRTRQFHPDPVDRGCNDCHLVQHRQIESGRLRARTRSTPSVFGKGYFRGNRAEFHQQSSRPSVTIGGRTRATLCADCHWGDAEDRPGPALSDRKIRQCPSDSQRTVGEIRRRYGRQMDGYPGVYQRRLCR